MPIVSIGDMSQHFLSLQNGGRIKSDLARLGQELSSGKAVDVVEKLSGQTRQLSGVTHSLDVLSAYQQSTQETALLLEQAQLGLDRLDAARARAMDASLAINAQSPPFQINQAAETTQYAFIDIVAALNSESGGRTIFGGTQVDRKPLLDAREMLDSILSGLSASPTQDDVREAVNQWFDDPAGGFATTGYLGSTDGFQSRPIGTDQSVSLTARADDPAMKNAMKAAAVGALVADLGSVLSQSDQAELLQAGGLALLGAASDLAGVRGSIGEVQGVVDASQARFASEATTLSIAQNEMTLADPFETAVRLQAIQTQLETHFAVTARLSRLSLAEYI